MSAFDSLLVLLSELQLFGLVWPTRNAYAQGHHVGDHISCVHPYLTANSVQKHHSYSG